MTMDREMQALIDKIGSSAVVVDSPPKPPSPVPPPGSTCPKCSKSAESETHRVRDRSRDVDTFWHPECWGAYLDERDQREAEKLNARRIAEHVKQIESRFDYYMGGHSNGRDGHGVCHPPQWPFARFDNVEFRARASKKIVSAIEKWDPAKFPTLLVSSPTGSGKSGATLAWLWRYRDQQLARAQAGDETARVVPFVWASGPELATARRNASLGQEAPLIEHARDTAILIIDELGFEKLTEVPFEVVDHRYRKQAVTVVTTGLRSSEFRARYGDAMFRRLAEGGAVVEDFPE